MKCVIQQDIRHIIEFKLEKSTNTVEVFVQKEFSLHYRHYLYEWSTHLFYVPGIWSNSFKNAHSHIVWEGSTCGIS